MLRFLFIITAFLYAVCLLGKDNKVTKFLFMTDIHVDDDFKERGKDIFTMWKPGNHAALTKTYEFINSDPYCKDIDFALFGGDQLNTGYFYHKESMERELVIYNETLKKLDIYSNTLGKNPRDLRFSYRKNYICKQNLAKGQEPVLFKAPKLKSRLIAIQGNHDTCYPGFYRECAWQSGSVKFISFFASYVGLPAPPGKFNSTGKISDEAIEFVEKEMIKAHKDPSIEHIVLVCHWSIVTDDSRFIHPIMDACKENKNNDNRKRLLALAEKYGCDLYINGHEHCNDFSIGKVGNMFDINCGTVTSNDCSWSIVEIHRNKAIFNIYSRANAVENADGSISYDHLPKLIKTLTIPLKPIR